MKLIHTSDWHLGRRLLSVDLMEYQARFLDWLLELAVNEEVDAVLVAGDVYDRSQPPAEAVKLLDRTISEFASAGVPLIITAGNHDNPVRLRYGRDLFAQMGVHVRAELASVTDPIVLSDEHGDVGVYGIPYLHPDAVSEELGASRSHESVLSVVCERVAQDAAERGLERTVVSAHAFITEATASESEMDIRVGGISDTPAHVFHGFNYVALGHLHGPQSVRLKESETTLSYSGSPLAFSFSERDHEKSVTLVDIDEFGAASVTRTVIPLQRRLRQVRGQLSDLIAMGVDETPELRESFTKVVLTDADRPESPMERLRAVWPNTLQLDFEPDVALGSDADAVRDLHGVTDPGEIVAKYFAHVTGQQLDPDRQRVVDDAVEAASRQEVNL